MLTIAMTKNPIFHASSKNDQEIHLDFVNTKEQLVDGFTKAVSSENFD